MSVFQEVVLVIAVVAAGMTVSATAPAPAAPTGVTVVTRQATAAAHQVGATLAGPIKLSSVGPDAVSVSPQAA